MVCTAQSCLHNSLTDIRIRAFVLDRIQDIMPTSRTIHSTTPNKQEMKVPSCTSKTFSPPTYSLMNILVVTICVQFMCATEVNAAVRPIGTLKETYSAQGEQQTNDILLPGQKLLLQPDSDEQVRLLRADHGLTLSGKRKSKRITGEAMSLRNLISNRFAVNAEVPGAELKPDDRAELDSEAITELTDSVQQLIQPSFFHFVQSCCNREVMRPMGGGHLTGSCCSQLFRILQFYSLKEKLLG
ncbi:unnamed protein product [Calicophoron daubneyi]|uniref:Uncharacterized protein n=1 Tax=Calicophoron daubneyi TaxID=300641 RepID=A0AAV2T7I6_CALDB